MNLERIKQSSIALMVVSILSKLLGMCRDLVLANCFGTSNISDAYLIAASVPTLLFYFIGHALSTAYIPMYNKIKTEKGVGASQNFSNNILNVSLILSSVLVAFLMIFPNLVVKIFAAGFDLETNSIAAKMIFISTPSIYFMCIINVLGGYLSANRNFLAPAAVSFPRNIALIAFIVVASKFGIFWLGAGLLICYLLEMLFLIPFAVKKSYKYKVTFNWKDEYLTETLYMVAPVFFGMFVGQLNKIIDRSMASSVLEGGVSALSYASIINNAVQEILVMGIVTILFANSAEFVSKGQTDKVKSQLSNSMKYMTFLIVPACIGVFVLAEPIVKFVLCRGAFNEVSLKITAGALRCYTVGLLFLAVRDTLVKIFYAYKDTKTTTIVSTVSILCNIVLNIVLGKLIGINGLALATSISSMVNCVALFILLRNKIGDFGTKGILAVLTKSILGGLLMGVLAHFVNSILVKNGYGLSALIISVLAGLFIYLALGFIMKNEPMVKVVRMVKKKVQERKGA